MKACPPILRGIMMAIILGFVITTGCAPAAASIPEDSPNPRTIEPTKTAGQAAEGRTVNEQTATETPMSTETPFQPLESETPTPTATQPMPTATREPTPVSPSTEEVIASLEGLPFDAFLEEAYRQLQLRDPDNLVLEGFDILYGAAINEGFTPLSTAYLDETHALEVGVLLLLLGYDREALSPDQRISYDCLEWYLDIQMEGEAYRGYKFLVNPVWGLQNLPVDFLLEHQLETIADAENYVARIANVALWAEGVVEQLALNEQAGATPPKYVVEDTMDQLDDILNIQGTGEPKTDQIEVYTHFRSKVRKIEDISSNEIDMLLESALTAVETGFVPGYQAIKNKLTALSTTAEENPNQWRLPGGKAHYDYLLAYHTGTDLSADEIHALGLAEMARLQADFRKAADVLGYPADISMVDLNRRLREENPNLTGSALVHKYEDILASADQAAGATFDLRSKAGVVVSRNPDGPPAFYQPPAPGSDEPGEMPVNPEINPLWFNYNEHVLVHHETIPGHHVQISLAQELEIPNIRRFYSVNPYKQDYRFLAYVEGWALYAENFAWEMGLYEGEPLANLGRLRLLLLQTVRMVVDTGIHAKGWTLDEAAEYLESVTGMTQNRAGLTRYLVEPGYPTGYNIGVLKIMEMRQRAKDQLGEAFDIKEFHNAILGHGVLPIGVLEGLVDDWLAAKLNP